MDYLTDKNLSFCVFELATNEQKLLSGRSYDRKKYGAVRLNRIPQELFDVKLFESMRDFLPLVPNGEFTVRELAAFADIDRALASKTVYCLKAADVICEIGMRKREKIYSKN